MTDATRYPLVWPFGWKRTQAGKQKHGRFAKYGKWITVAAATERLEQELGRLGVRDYDTIISSNLKLGMRGDPLSGQPEPSDRGVAVYFKLNKKDRVLACDRYTDVASNIAAIAAHVECVRGIDRYGVGTLDQAFAGYDALPPPGATNRPPWRKVFGIPEDMPATPSAVQGFYRDLAMKFHPDKPGGSHEAMAQLNEARDAAMKELSE